MPSTIHIYTLYVVTQDHYYGALFVSLMLLPHNEENYTDAYCNFTRSTGLSYASPPMSYPTPTVQRGRTFTSTDLVNQYSKETTLGSRK
jgi:hypothetical protein